MTKTQLTELCGILTYSFCIHTFYVWCGFVKQQFTCPELVPGIRQSRLYLVLKNYDSWLWSGWQFPEGLTQKDCLYFAKTETLSGYMSEYTERSICQKHFKGKWTSIFHLKQWISVGVNQRYNGKPKERLRKMLWGIKVSTYSWKLKRLCICPKWEAW